MCNITKVIIESPYSGNVKTHLEYARACVHDSLSKCEAPIASHLLYTQTGILDDNIPEERQWGIDSGLTWANVAEKHIFYIDYGMSTGMLYAYKHAKKINSTIEFRTIYPKLNLSTKKKSKSYV